MCINLVQHRLPASPIARGNTVSRDGRASIWQGNSRTLGLSEIAAHPMSTHLHTLFREIQILCEVTAQNHLAASGKLAGFHSDGGDGGSSIRQIRLTPSAAVVVQQ